MNPRLRPSPGVAGRRKALIKVGYACNEHCSFCHTQDVRHIQGTSAEVEARIDRAAELGHDMVVLSGGEATIRPELLQWAQRIAGHGMDLGLVTNGLVLAYDRVLQPLLDLRLRYVYMSLHGAAAKIHNRLVRADSHAAALAALDNLTGRGLDLTINCVVTRHNVDHLVALTEFVSRYPDATLKFSAVEPKGGADHLFDRLVPDIAEAADKVAAAIDHGIARADGHGPRFTHGGYPLCLLPRHAARYDDLRTHHFRTMVEIGEPDFFVVDDLNKTQPSGVCDECRHRGACPGLFSEYVARRGAAVLRPEAGGLRGNSFDWVLEDVLQGAAAPCPLLREGVTPWDRGRDLFVRHEGKIARYRCESRDFSDAQIVDTKHRQGQVYLDASRKAAPDDFARDLVPLRRSAECGSCRHEADCTGMFEPELTDVFSRDDARVREVIAALAGDVLDVGCGEGPYDDLLEPAVRAGAVRYLGLEPDAELARDVTRRRGWGEVMAVEAERFDAGPLRFDHVLVLRSFNHLRDPDAALDRIVAALRDAGRVTIVDNVAFGLARMPAQTRRARTSTARWEHHRNATAAAAAAALAARGLTEVLRVEVGPTTANQWLVQYQRTAT
jgi:MoaA/NifB/PqqE/SkfB family radical SAM enzyme/SAM-dependent methyltransferase